MDHTVCGKARTKWDSLRPRTWGKSRHPILGSQLSNTDPVFIQGRHSQGDFKYGQLAEDGCPLGPSELPHPCGWLKSGSKDRCSPWRAFTPDTRFLHGEGASSFSAQKRAPPTLRKTRCQPPWGECDIPLKQASCFTALLWKTSKT